MNKLITRRQALQKSIVILADAMPQVKGPREKLHIVLDLLRAIESGFVIDDLKREPGHAELAA